MSNQSNFVPPARLAIIRWLAAPARELDADAQGELRAGMFRRIESLVLSTVVNLGITVICYVQSQTRLLLWWLVIDTTLNVVRVAGILYLTHDLKERIANGTVRPSSVDWFIAAGTIWAAQLGIGVGLYMASGDPVLGIFGSVLAMGTVGGQCARNPVAPRLMRTQMLLVVVPYSLCALYSTIAAVHWIPLLGPLYMLAMMNINRELHADYVAMIEARIKDRRRALHCSLTGLPNRVFFQQKVAAALERAKADCRSIAVLFLDLDGFKTVNDGLGHPVGDALLKLVAQRMGSLAPSASMAARLGGDEFAILMPDGNGTTAEALARAVIASLREPFTLGDHVIRIGVSIGIALGGHNAAETFDALLESADRALYAAKRAGKDTFRLHDEASPVIEGAWHQQPSGAMQAA